MYASLCGAFFSSLCCRLDLGSCASEIYIFVSIMLYFAKCRHEWSYRSRNLGVDAGEVDEGLVEVLDGLCGVFRRLVADIANAAVREDLDVGDRKLCKVRAHFLFCECRRQSAHEYA